MDPILLLKKKRDQEVNNLLRATRRIEVYAEDPDGIDPPTFTSFSRIFWGSIREKPIRVTSFDQKAHSGLNFNYSDGIVQIGRYYQVIPGGTIVLSDNTTNFIYVDPLTCSVEKGTSTTGWPYHGVIRLYNVDTSDGEITSVVDCRSFMSALHCVPSAGLYNSTDLSIPSDTATILTFDGEEWDCGDFHSFTTNPSRLTVPADGIYGIFGLVTWAGSSNGSYRKLEILMNGSLVIGVSTLPPIGTENVSQCVSTIFKCSKNDYFELRVKQDSGSSLDILALDNSPRFAICYLSGF